MDKLFYLIWLADDLKPKVSQNYYLTSRGLTSKDFFDRKKTTVFLNRNQLDNDNTYYYESSYTVYELEEKYFEKSNVIEVEENDLGDFKSVSFNESEITYFIRCDSLFIFDIINNPNELIYSLYKKYKFKYVYSKTKFNACSDAILFYFKNEKVLSNDPFINEASKLSLIGDKSDSENFKFAFFNPDFKNKNPFPLYMFVHDENKYESYLENVDVKEFIELVKKIKEFNFDKYYDEFSYIKEFNGEFYKVVVDNKTIGIFDIAFSGETFLFIECLAVFEEYRNKKYNGKLYSSYLMDSLKYLANKYNKNVVLTIEESKLSNFYLSQKFKSVGPFYFD